MSNCEKPDSFDTSNRIRTTIVQDAARLLLERQESSISAAKHRAARSAFRTYIRPADFPTDAEIATAVADLRRASPVPSVIQHTADHQHVAADACWDQFETWLVALEEVTFPPHKHAGANALDHSLQVFTVVSEIIPYDEELLTAALLHEVGWLSDPRNADAQSCEMLAGRVTDRTLWFVTHLPEANRHFGRSLGTRARRRLNDSEDSDELWALTDGDRKRHVAGKIQTTAQEAIQTLRTLAGQ